MINMKTQTVARAFFCAVCLAAAPFSAIAQEQTTFPTTYIDVFQDGSLYITYDEYRERQRRVEAARATSRVIPAPLAAPVRRAPVTAAVTGTTMSLRNQWTIGAFR